MNSVTKNNKKKRYPAFFPKIYPDFTGSAGFKKKGEHASFARELCDYAAKTGAGRHPPPR